MNRKGFTLVELLAALVILGLLMSVAGPTVFNLLNNNRINTYLEDGKKFATAVEYKLKSTTKVVKPTAGNCIAINMEYLQTSDFEEAPYGGSYNQLSSFVLVKRNSDRSLTYYVRLVEDLDNDTFMGINFAKYEDLSHDSSKKLVVGIKNEPEDIYASNASGVNSLKEYIKGITFKDLSGNQKKVKDDICSNISNIYYLD